MRIRTEVEEAVKKDHAHCCSERDARPQAITQNVRVTRAVTSQPNSSTSTTPKLPRLTDAERAVLDKYDGCRKCRKLFVGHRAAECPDGFASGLNYVPITEATATAARAAVNVPAPSPQIIKKEPVVAAV